MAFEDSLSAAMFSERSEKTFIDKLLGREDANRVKEIIKKPRLKREDLLELLHLLSGTESKLVNYSSWDRYLVLKFFVWIREFIKIAENFYDYREQLNKKNIKLSERANKLLDSNEKNIEHAAKFLIDLYFNIMRTSLSTGATGFLEILKNKFEVNYPLQAGLTPQPQQQGGGFSLFKR